MILTQEQADSLDRDGYFVASAALDSDSVTRLCAAFADDPPSSGTEHVDIDEKTPNYGVWQALPTHPLVEAASERVLQSPAHLSQLHGRNPLPGFGHQGLHTDWLPRSSGDPFFVVTTIWMLDDFTTANGATRVVPGSHVIARPIPRSYAQPLARHPGEKIITGAAGSVLIFNGHLWHSGTRNDTSRPRRAVQMVLRADSRGAGRR